MARGAWTDTGRAQRGIDFLRDRPSIWLGYGRTSPWPDESTPPKVNRRAVTVEEMFGLKLLSDAALVVPDENGPIKSDEVRYRRVTNQEGLDLQTPHMYLDFILQPHELAEISYRQVGVFVDAIPAEGFGSFSLLTPNRFQSLGRLVYLANFPKRTRYPNTRHEHVVITVPEAEPPSET